MFRTTLYLSWQATRGTAAIAGGLLFLLPLAAIQGVAFFPDPGAGEALRAYALLDGLELYDPFHLKDRQGLVSIIDARTVAGVGVLDGAFPAFQPLFGQRAQRAVLFRDPPDHRDLVRGIGVERVDADVKSDQFFIGKNLLRQTLLRPC